VVGRERWDIHFGEFMDGWSEFFLDVTYAIQGQCSSSNVLLIAHYVQKCRIGLSNVSRMSACCSSSILPNLFVAMSLVVMCWAKADRRVAAVAVDEVMYCRAVLRLTLADLKII
jgi:hypothetical protein